MASQPPRGPGDGSVLFAQEVEHGPLNGRRLRRSDVVDRRAAGPDQHGLSVGGQKAAGEILEAAIGDPVVVEQEIAGQPVVFGPEPIRHPRTDAGGRTDGSARVQQQGLGPVQRTFAAQRTDDAEIVGNAGDVREQIADPQPRLAALLEVPETFEPAAIGADRLRQGVGPPHRRLAVPAGKFGLAIE